MALSNASQRKAAKAAGPVGATCASRQPGVRDHPRYFGKTRARRGDPGIFTPLSETAASFWNFLSVASVRRMGKRWAGQPVD